MSILDDIKNLRGSIKKHNPKRKVLDKAKNKFNPITVDMKMSPGHGRMSDKKKPTKNIARSNLMVRLQK